MKNLISGAAEDPYPLETKSLIKQMEIIKDFDSSELLDKINVPCLVIGCENDIIFSTKDVKKLTAFLQRAEYHEIINASHSAHLEQPGPIASTIARFLSDEES